MQRELVGGVRPLRAETAQRFRYTVPPRRGTQVGRERSAKPSFVGSIPTRASIKYTNKSAYFLSTVFNLCSVSNCPQPFLPVQ